MWRSVGSGEHIVADERVEDLHHLDLGLFLIALDHRRDVIHHDVEFTRQEEAGCHIGQLGLPFLGRECDAHVSEEALFDTDVADGRVAVWPHGEGNGSVGDLPSG